MIRHLLTFLALAAGLTTAGCAQSDEGSLSWQAVDALVERDFPGVESISTDSLATWMADTARLPPLLLDAREAEEYAVSHLPGAVRVAPDGSAEALRTVLADVDPARPVVVYCSVGYRSARVTQQLREAGVAGEAYNLEGSIFRWANEGRPVVRDGEPVQEVHPYDAAWGRLLRRDLHAD